MTDDASPLPVAIVGAGIVGVATALWLQRAGLPVVLIDREGPAAGTSYGNAGVLASSSVVPVTVPGLLGKAPGMALRKNQPLFLRWSYLPRMMPWLAGYLSHCKPQAVERIAAALTPILGNSLQDHLALAKGTAAERYISPASYVYVYNNRQHFLADSYAWQIRRKHGFEWTEIEGAAFHSEEPVFSSEQSFGAFTHNHGRISDPGSYVRALADHFVANGGTLLVGGVEDFVSEHGKVTGVRCDGNTIACSAAVIATGAWSRPLMKKIGYSIPLEAERGYHIELFEPSVAPKMPSMIAERKFVLTPMDGRLRVAGLVEFGGLIAGASDEPLEFLKRHIHRVIPGLQWTETKEWLGHRPAPIDSIPVIGEAPALKGLYMGFGHQHVGLTGGARTGQLLAEMISGRGPSVDMTPYRPDRFG